MRALLLLCAAGLPTLAAVYHCEKDGAVVLTDRPCSQGRKVSVRYKDGPDLDRLPAPAAGPAQEQQGKRAWPAGSRCLGLSETEVKAIRRSLLRQSLALCMTKAQVLSLTGKERYRAERFAAPPYEIWQRVLDEENWPGRLIFAGDYLVALENVD
ncbi:hypothetical protein [Gallaecimonas sp. GXIMD4217]|uniref:hypothetical protein n=1 Tax=Gallaecimonas sp. GXIMD4217 TaxID=3131927 RepID=UPI00311AD0E6